MFLTYLSARSIERVTKLLTKHFFLTLQTADFSLCAWKRKMVAWSTVAVWVLHKDRSAIDRNNCNMLLTQLFPSICTDSMLHLC